MPRFFRHMARSADLAMFMSSASAADTGIICRAKLCHLCDPKSSKVIRIALPASRCRPIATIEDNGELLRDHRFIIAVRITDGFCADGEDGRGKHNQIPAPR